VNFDASVVGQKDAVTAISYNHATNTCALTCHGHTH